MVALNKTYRKTLTPDRSAKDSGRRFYSPEVSRWLSRDPIQYHPASLYSYVGNSVNGSTDPRGALNIQKMIQLIKDDPEAMEALAEFKDKDVSALTADEKTKLVELLANAYATKLDFELTKLDFVWEGSLWGEILNLQDIPDKPCFQAKVNKVEPSVTLTKVNTFGNTYCLLKDWAWAWVIEKKLAKIGKKKLPWECGLPCEVGLKCCPLFNATQTAGLDVQVKHFPLGLFVKYVPDECVYDMDIKLTLTVELMLGECK